jgi:hypothetical protein
MRNKIEAERAQLQLAIALADRLFRHERLMKKTAAWEALQFCRKHFPWRAK